MFKYNIKCTESVYIFCVTLSKIKINDMPLGNPYSIQFPLTLVKNVCFFFIFSLFLLCRCGYYRSVKPNFDLFALFKHTHTYTILFSIESVGYYFGILLKLPASIIHFIPNQFHFERLMEKCLFASVSIIYSKKKKLEK